MLAIEAKDSLELYRTRMRKANGHRRLHHHHHMRTADNSRPRVKDRTEHGMMIDAGSQGTRIHVYEFEPRILSHVKEMKEAVAGRKLSIPTTDTRWTNRLKPGLDSFAFVDDQDKMVTKVAAYLEPLIEFAETVLVHKKAHWGQYPIYLKATGGLRTLPRPYRIRLINAVRTLMQNKTFNPFYFEDEYVISESCLLQHEK